MVEMARPWAVSVPLGVVHDLLLGPAGGSLHPDGQPVYHDRLAGRNGKPDIADFTVYDRSDQAPIGFSSLFRIDHRNGTTDFGSFLGERRGKGLGTEATRLSLDWGLPCSACTT